MKTLTEPLDTRTIQGVTFEAVRLDHPRVPGSHFYRAKVRQTGFVCPQEYRSRPDMWERLERDAQACGPRFATDSLSAK